MRNFQTGRYAGNHSWPIPNSTGLINVDRSFILYAKCSITYNGRAKSSLEDGRFLIIHKSDGTLLIHADSLCTPRNYQPPGAILKYIGNQLISTRKDETIVITISELINYYELQNWASHKPVMSKTENELKIYLASHISEFFTGTVKEIFIEYQIPVGFIDVLVIDDIGYRHVIELKRKTVGVTTIYQLQRYMDYFAEVSIPAKGYTAGPSISKNAALQLEKKGYQHLSVQHQ